MISSHALVQVIASCWNGDDARECSHDRGSAVGVAREISSYLRRKNFNVCCRIFVKGFQPRIQKADNFWHVMRIVPSVESPVGTDNVESLCCVASTIRCTLELLFQFGIFCRLDDSHEPVLRFRLSVLPVLAVAGSADEVVFQS